MHEKSQEKGSYPVKRCNENGRKYQIKLDMNGFNKIMEQSIVLVLA